MYYIDDGEEYNDGKCYVKNQNILVETDYTEKGLEFLRKMLYKNLSLEVFVITDINKNRYIVDRDDLEVFLVLQLTEINYGDFWNQYMYILSNPEEYYRKLHDKVMDYMVLIGDCEKASDNMIVSIDYEDLLDVKLFYMTGSDIIIEVDSNAEELKMLGKLLREDETKNAYLIQDIFKKKFTVNRKDIYNFYQSYSDYDCGSYLAYLKRKFALQLKN